MNGRARAWLMSLHRWTGLSVGLVIVVLACTGAAMMFRPQLDPIVHRDLLTVASCTGQGSIDAMTAQAVAAHPASKIDFIRMVAPVAGADRLPATWIRFLDKETFYFDPCTARLLGQENRYSGVFGTIERMHRFRYFEGASVIPGTSALAFAVILVLGGVLLWLPPKLRNLRKAARLNPKLRGPARRINLHRTFGIYAAPVVLMSALTGPTQSFGWYKDLAYGVAGSAQPGPGPRSIVPAGGQRLAMDDYLAAAKRLSRDPEELQLRYPVKPDDAIEGFLIERGAPHPNARSMFHLDAYTGKTLEFDPYAKATSGHRFYFWTLSWHHGLVGGVFTQILVFGGALALLVIAYSGISNWLRRKLKRGQKASRPGAAPQISREPA